MWRAQNVWHAITLWGESVCGTDWRWRLTIDSLWLGEEFQESKPDPVQVQTGIQKWAFGKQLLASRAYDFQKRKMKQGKGKFFFEMSLSEPSFKVDRVNLPLLTLIILILLHPSLLQSAACAQRNPSIHALHLISEHPHDVAGHLLSQWRLEKKKTPGRLQPLPSYVKWLQEQLPEHFLNFEVISELFAIGRSSLVDPVWPDIDLLHRDFGRMLSPFSKEKQQNTHRVHKSFFSLDTGNLLNLIFCDRRPIRWVLIILCSHNLWGERKDLHGITHQIHNFLGACVSIGICWLGLIGKSLKSFFSKSDGPPMAFQDTDPFLQSLCAFYRKKTPSPRKLQNVIMESFVMESFGLTLSVICTFGGRGAS